MVKVKRLAMGTAKRKGRFGPTKKQWQIEPRDVMVAAFLLILIMAGLHYFKPIAFLELGHLGGRINPKGMLSNDSVQSPIALPSIDEMEG